MGRNIENENPQRRKGIDLETAADEIIVVLHKYGIKIALMDAVFKQVESKVRFQEVASPRILRNADTGLNIAFGNIADK